MVQKIADFIYRYYDIGILLLAFYLAISAGIDSAILLLVLCLWIERSDYFGKVITRFIEREMERGDLEL